MKAKLANPNSQGNLPWSAGLLLFLSLGWIFFYSDVYLGANEVWPRDNAKHHFPMFLYISRYLRLLNQIPNWMYSDEGGIWIETLSNNFLVLMPHRLLGYAVAYFSNWEPNQIYKLAVLVGESLFLFGCYLAARRLHFNRNMSWLLVLVFFFSSVTLTFIHQEHALGTLFYIPFLWYGLCLLRDSPSPLFFLGCLLGLSLNNHYPHLIFLYFGCVLLAALADYREMRFVILKILGNLKGAGWKLWILSTLAFLISASPVFYSYFKFSDQLESPFRHQKGGIQPQSYEEYEHINSAFSKVDPRNFGIYFNFEGAERWNISLLDDNLFYASPCIAFLILLLLFTKVPHRKFHLFLILSMILLSMGTFTSLPRYLMYLVPTLRIFRQWYFFSAFLSLHLIIALFYSLRALLEENRTLARSSSWFIIGTFLFLLCFKLPLLYALPGAVFCFLQARCVSGLIAWKRALLYSWLILGSLFSSRFILETYRENLISIESTHLYKTHQMGPLLELRNIYLNFVARTNRLDEARRGLTRRGAYSIDDEILSSARLIPGGFSIALPKTAKTFEWLQVNDGKWVLSSEMGKSVYSSQFPKLEMYSGNTSPGQVRIQRKSSLWNLLVWVMWLPMTLGFFGILYAKWDCIWVGRKAINA